MGKTVLDLKVPKLRLWVLKGVRVKKVKCQQERVRRLCPIRLIDHFRMGSRSK